MAELGVHYTNHSLQATAITRMYKRGVPEKLISDKSGHRSLKGLRSYKRTSSIQEKAAGECMSWHNIWWVGRSALEKIQLPPGFPKACDVKLPTFDVPKTCQAFYL